MSDVSLIQDESPLASPEAQDFRGLHYPLGRWAPNHGVLHPITDGVFWLRMPLPISLDHINLWVLDDGINGWVLVDTGLNSSACRAVWDQLFAGPLSGRPVSRIIVTHYHPDHIGLAGWLAARTGAPLWIARTEYLLARMLTLDAQPEPPSDVLNFFKHAGWPHEWLERMRASGWGHFAKGVSALPSGFQRIQDGDALQIGGRTWQVVTGRGHAPEHSCLACDEAGLMISGDQVLPRITSNVSVYPTEPEANPLQDWFDSIDRLSRLSPDLHVLPSHNEPFIGLHTRLEQLRHDHDDKLAKLIALCQEAPRTAVDCFPSLFKRTLGPGDVFPATGEALAHLNYLRGTGALTRLDDGDVMRYAA
jgi:glyoxylase-like metal-dependent hydrolase (beta-lactamase superfamily II)